MNAELLGFILDVIGKIMIAFTAITAHRQTLFCYHSHETITLPSLSW